MEVGVHPLVDRVLSRVLLGLGFVRRRCLAAELGFAGGAWLLYGFLFLVVAGDAEATVLQGNNSRGFFDSPVGDLLRRQWRGQGDLCCSPGPAHHRLLQVMMMLTYLIPRNMISGGNPSFARVVGVGFEVASWGPELANAPGRQCTRHLRLAVSPPLRPLLCGDWRWRLATIGKRFGWR
ncbi:hypothetical protein HU200_062711 [Digitaria exilis]|uniref:Uncharacterized protein n=1 Tax=Digitaria exilis TaxID=1010633 RepID=A0A835A560_9POAL|nr:hypothetical protein HU200_062711 [Digitaria exilis]